MLSKKEAKAVLDEQLEKEIRAKSKQSYEGIAQVADGHLLPTKEEMLEKIALDYINKQAAEAFLEGLPEHVKEIRIKDPETGGEKGQKLERYDLIPTGPLAEVARIYGKGATKYADRNWELGYKYSLSYAALQRHVNAFWSGENNDPELGLSHLAAAIFHCMALMEFLNTHPEKDDRPKK